MNEQVEQKLRRTKEPKPVRPGDTSRRERRAIEERCEAVRRWITEDDEPAIRGID